MSSSVQADPDIRIIYMGTPEFAVPSLHALVEAGMKPLLVITQPDRPQGRKQRLTPPPVKVVAESYGIPVLQPESLLRAEGKALRETVAALKPDILLTASYGKLLPEALLKLAAVEALNVHGSLLPRYRGASPVQQAVINGDQTSGITIMRMVKAMDQGPMFRQEPWTIGPNTTADELMDELAELAARILPETLRQIVAGELTAVAQDEQQATYVSMLDRDSGKIDWNASAEAIHNLVRGTHSWPGAYSYYQGQRMKILRTQRVDAAEVQARSERDLDLLVPGEIALHRKGLWVKTGDGVIYLEAIQPAGKTVQQTKDVSHNYAPGTIFTNEASES